MINEPPRDYDKGEGSVILTEKALSDSQNMHLLVGIAAGCVGTIIALVAFFSFFVSH